MCNNLRMCVFNVYLNGHALARDAVCDVCERVYPSIQHPPESVPKLFQALDCDNHDFVIGTRYGKGVAIDDNWPMHRRVISKGARMLGAALTPLSDPMTGFFGLPAAVVRPSRGCLSAECRDTILPGLCASFTCVLVGRSCACHCM